MTLILIILKSNDTIIANSFNKYFTSIGPDLANKIPFQNNNDYLHYLHGHNNTNIFFEPTAEDEVYLAFNRISSSTAGWDKFTKKILESITPNLLTCLTHIIHTSFVTGIVPSELKIAKVLPFFKAHDPFMLNNYRPISILPIISKIFERLVNKRITKFLNKFKLFNDYQISFRDNHSTDSALAFLNYNITQAFDKKQITLGIFLDLSKAFDTVNF